MGEALYRKYRPSTFGAVAGQEHVKRTLLNQIQGDTVAHAYLFSGPRGVGKTTLARLLAKGVNCSDRKKGEPCGTCASCEAFEQNRTLDIIEMDAASHTGVDNVRENIIEAVRVPPGVGERKVFIIDEVHMLSTSAFNALLKTLEEPPAHALFVLATTEVHKIPQTILSRCQRFDFKRLDPAVMKERLAWMAKEEGVEVESEVLDAAVRVSEGCLRDAESLLGQLLALGEKKIDVDTASLVLPVTYASSALELLESLAKSDTQACLAHLATFVTQGGSIRHLTDECISLVRALLLIQLGSSDARYDDTTQARLSTLAQSFTTTQARWLLDAFLASKTKPTSDMFPQLTLELVCVEFVERFGKKDEPPSRGGSADERSTGEEISPPPAAESKWEEEGTDEAQHAASFSVEDLAAKWLRCCEVVAKQNIALPLVLQNAKPVAIEGTCVHVGFEHKFHFETMEQTKNADILAKAINEIMQSSVTIRAIYLQKEADDTVGELVEAFGGSIVE